MINKQKQGQSTQVEVSCIVHSHRSITLLREHYDALVAGVRAALGYGRVGGFFICYNNAEKTEWLITQKSSGLFVVTPAYGENDPIPQNVSIIEVEEKEEVEEETKVDEPVSAEDFDYSRERLIKSAQEMWDQKNASYSCGEAGGDTLANITQIAGLLGLPRKTIVAVYFAKHVFSIFSAVARDEDGGEDLHSRLIDAHNYLCMLQALDDKE